MPRFAHIASFATIALLFQAGCVQSQYVPSNFVGAPTPTATSAAPPLSANPTSLTLSASAIIPPNGVFPTLTISQNGATSPPFVIQAQSTCLTNGNLSIVNTFSGGFSSTYQVQGTKTGTCVLVFGGIGGATLVVPVTVTP
jgi:hypothetical protein